MALDAAKMAAMRGEPDGDKTEAPSDDGPQEGEEGEPSTDQLEAAGRAIQAVKLGDRRAFLAAIKDCGE